MEYSPIDPNEVQKIQTKAIAEFIAEEIRSRRSALMRNSTVRPTTEELAVYYICEKIAREFDFERVYEPIEAAKQRKEFEHTDSTRRKLCELLAESSPAQGLLYATPNFTVTLNWLVDKTEENKMQFTDLRRGMKCLYFYDIGNDESVPIEIYIVDYNAVSNTVEFIPACIIDSPENKFNMQADTFGGDTQLFDPKRFKPLESQAESAA